MYDKDIKDVVINDLVLKTMNVAKAFVVLTDQGFVINKTKKIRQQWSSILIHAFENIDVFTPQQQTEIENLYNKIQTI
uniref:Uncharacterized protein n=1 Tax=Geladintestivirus 2 TaxID=3233134 RepID=A0AAU8MHU7_9CAUD